MFWVTFHHGMNDLPPLSSACWEQMLGRFGLLEPVFRPHLGGQREAFLDEKLEKPYQIFAIPFAVVLAGVSILLEVGAREGPKIAETATHSASHLLKRRESRRNDAQPNAEDNWKSRR